MNTWYAIVRIADGIVVGYTSDDAAGYGALPATLKYVGPYTTQSAAQAANEPVVVTPKQQQLQTLLQKPANTWTLTDLAAWLQAKG